MILVVLRSKPSPPTICPTNHVHACNGYFVGSSNLIDLKIAAGLVQPFIWIPSAKVWKINLQFRAMIPSPTHVVVRLIKLPIFGSFKDQLSPIVPPVIPLDFIFTT
ncbi:hypothetical protein ACOSQ4_010422 [Xanthoceras sorbifolium]